MILNNLKRICSERGITINRIEQDCGFSHGSVRKWSNHPPTITRAKVVCDYLGIRLDDLFIQEQPE